MRANRTTRLSVWTALGIGMAVLLAAIDSPKHAVAERVDRGGSLRASVSNCLVSLIEDVQIPAKEAGVLVGFNVKQGALVEKDALLAKIDDRIAQNEHDAALVDYRAAREQADNDINVRYAAAAADVAEAEYQAAVEANQRVRGAISPAELRRLQLEAKRAKLQIEQSQLEQKMSKYNVQRRTTEVTAADEAVRRRQITAPVDGVIHEIYRQAGEWVNPGDPVLRIVRVDRLRIEGFLNVTEISPIEVIDRPVAVQVELARGQKARFEGRVVYVSQLVQAGGQYRVWAEVENRSVNKQWLLRPGLTAEMTIR